MSCLVGEGSDDDMSLLGDMLEHHDLADSGLSVLENEICCGHVVVDLLWNVSLHIASA